MDYPSKVCRLIAGSLSLPVLVAFVGCTSLSPRKRADDASYKVVSRVEKKIFGGASEFSIDTEYTGRNPQDVHVDEIFEDRESSERLALSLEEAIELALEKSRTYQSEKERLYLAALDLTGERHAFRPNFFARATGRKNVSETGFETETLDGQAGVGLLLATGADLSVNMATDILRFVSNPSSEAASSVLSFSIFQPLLRGAGHRIAAEQLTQAHRDVVYAVRDFTHFQNEFTVDIVMDYFRLLQRKDTVYNEYNNYQSRIESTRYLKARSVDREKALNVNQAEQAELSARNRYITSIVNYRNALDRFKIALGLPQTVGLQLNDSEMEALQDRGLIVHSFGAEEGFRLATENRLPLLNEIDQFEDVKRKTRLAANGLKMNLGVFANASVDSLGSNDYDRFDFDRVRRDVGISLDLPLNKVSERNNYRAALIRFESEIRSLGLSLDQLRSQIEENLQELQRLSQNYEIQLNAVRLAEKQVHGAQLSIESGNAIYRDLEEAQDDLIAAQNAQTAALVDYLEARLELLINIGILDQDTDRFWLTEASRVDLGKASGATTNSTTIRSDGSVITPDQLFAQ